MQPRLSWLIVVLLTAAGFACGRNSPAPVPSAPTPAPTPVTPSPSPSPSPRPSPTFVRWAYGNPNKLPATLGLLYHMQAWAEFSDRTLRDVADEAIWQSSNTVVATVSAPPGVLMTAAQVGDADVHATYQGFDLVYAVSVSRRTYGPPYPDEVVGKVHEIGNNEIWLGFANVQISGGDELDGR